MTKQPKATPEQAAPDEWNEWWIRRSAHGRLLEYGPLPMAPFGHGDSVTRYVKAPRAVVGSEATKRCTNCGMMPTHCKCALPCDRDVADRAALSDKRLAELRAFPLKASAERCLVKEIDRLRARERELHDDFAELQNVLRVTTENMKAADKRAEAAEALLDRNAYCYACENTFTQFHGCAGQTKRLENAEARVRELEYVLRFETAPSQCSVCEGLRLKLLAALEEK